MTLSKYYHRANFTFAAFIVSWNNPFRDYIHMLPTAIPLHTCAWHDHQRICWAQNRSQAKETRVGDCFGIDQRGTLIYTKAIPNSCLFCLWNRSRESWSERRLSCVTIWMRFAGFCIQSFGLISDGLCDPRFECQCVCVCVCVFPRRICRITSAFRVIRSQNFWSMITTAFRVIGSETFDRCVYAEILNCDKLTVFTCLLLSILRGVHARSELCSTRPPLPTVSHNRKC